MATDYLTARERQILEAGIKAGFFVFDEATDTITYVAQGVSDNLLDREERVRMTLFYELVTQYEYKNDKKIIDLEVRRVIGHPHKKNASKVDIIVYSEDGKPFMLFELKSRLDYDRYFDDSIKTQLFERAANEDKGSGAVAYLVYYTCWDESGSSNEKLVTIDYSRYKTFEDWEVDNRPNLRLIPKHYTEVEKPPAFVKGVAESELRRDVTREEMSRIASQMHDVLWGGGKYQNELFYNLMGLFLAKILDEKTTSDGQAYRFQVLFKGNAPEPAKSVAERVKGLYREALKRLLALPDDDIAKMANIGFDDNKVRYVVETVQDIALTSNRYDILGDFFEQIVRSELKQTKGQYLTHPNIVDFMLYAVRLDDMAVDLMNGEQRLPYIIDPSCGSGTFLIHAMKLIDRVYVDRAGDFSTSDAVQEKLEQLFPPRKRNAWAQEYIYGVEINADLAMASKVNMVGHGDGNAHILRADGLSPFAEYSDLLAKTKGVSSYDFPVNERFDLVISNPPFSVPVDADTASSLPKAFERGQKVYDSIKKRKSSGKSEAVDTETLFLERYYQVLRQGGRLAVVLPDSVLDTTTNTEVRLFLFHHFWIKAVISLPLLAFAPYTGTKTSLLLAQKKTHADALKWEAAWKKASGRFDSAKASLAKLRSSAKRVRDNKKEVEKHLSLLLGRKVETSDEDARNGLSAFWDDVKAVEHDQWVFREIAPQFDQPVFLAHSEEVGYKRGVRYEERPNFLFRSDITPEGSRILLDDKRDAILDHLRATVQWT